MRHTIREITRCPSFGEAAIALSVVALGAALVADQLISREGAIGLLALAGVVHGHARRRSTGRPDPAVYVVGVVATVALHAAGVALGYVMRDRATIGALVAGVGAGIV